MTLKTWWTGPPSECCETGWGCESCDRDYWTPQEHWWAFKTNVRFRFKKFLSWASWYLPFTPRMVYLVVLGKGKEQKVLPQVYRNWSDALGGGLASDEYGPHQWLTIRPERIK